MSRRGRERQGALVLHGPRLGDDHARPLRASLSRQRGGGGGGGGGGGAAGQLSVALDGRSLIGTRRRLSSGGVRGRLWSGATLDEELQRRAVAIAMQYPGALDGSLEDSWDQIWLRLGEELGWPTLAKIDAEALRNGIRVAVEMEHVREAVGVDQNLRFSDLDEQTRERIQALVARTRLASGEVFDGSRWVGPLLKEGARERLKNVQKEWQRQQAGGLHPAFSVSVWDFDDRWIQPMGVWGSPPSLERVEGTLIALRAPATCRAVRLPTPSGRNWFDPGSRLPLRLALEIALSMGDSRDQILLCLPGRLGYPRPRGRKLCRTPGFGLRPSLCASCAPVSAGEERLPADLSERSLNTGPGTTPSPTV